jgi:hypothetical protein
MPCGARRALTWRQRIGDRDALYANLAELSAVPGSVLAALASACLSDVGQ